MKLHHFVTVTRFDAINIRGWASIVRFSGGGSVVVTKRGLEVYSRQPERLRQALNRIAK